MSRKKKSGVWPITIQLPIEIYNLLEELSIVKGIKKPELVRTAIINMLNDFDKETVRKYGRKTRRTNYINNSRRINL